MLLQFFGFGSVPQTSYGYPFFLMRLCAVMVLASGGVSAEVWEVIKNCLPLNSTLNTHHIVFY